MNGSINSRHVKASRLGRNRSWIVPILALASALGYVVIARASGLSGFPLDDAWIHQTYARNLSETGKLAFLPGQPSAGSTSPAWSYLLSVGYMIGIDYRLWTYLLGAASLAASAWLTYRLLLRLPSGLRTSGHGVSPGLLPMAALLAGLFCAVEWHLVWAAASGMETMLFVALSLALLDYAFSQITLRQSTEGPASVRAEQAVVSAIGIGLLAGILILTRPEGLVLSGMVIAALFVFPWPANRSELSRRLLTTSIALAGLAVILAPYVLFNLNTAGSIFPNTLYAKQAEYRFQTAPLIRFWRVLSPTLVGAQVLVVPGFLYAVYRIFRQRQWPALLPFAWWLVFLLMYAWCLPVAYQHGRYAMPTIPLLILYGVWGTAALLRPHARRVVPRVLSRAAPLAIAVLALIFWGRGALAYRDDVGMIEGEMVAMAHWLNENTPTGSLLAVHDIGAVGYLIERPLLDLAGLITPEVIPFITDPDALADWMVANGADYAVFFPDFSDTYHSLSTDPRLRVVFCTDHAWTRAQGHENMCAYRLSNGTEP